MAYYLLPLQNNQAEFWDKVLTFPHLVQESMLISSRLIQIPESLSSYLLSNLIILLFLYSNTPALIHNSKQQIYFYQLLSDEIILNNYQNQQNNRYQQMDIQENNGQNKANQQQPATPQIQQDKKETIKQQQTNDKQKDIKEKDKKDKQKQKTMTVTVKEMNTLTKKITKMQALIKSLEATKKQLQPLRAESQVHKKENSQLRDYLTALQKKYEEAKKGETSKQGMEETIRHLQKMVDESSKNEQRARKQQAKYRQFLKHQKQMASGLKVQVQDLRRMSSQYFLLKQEVSRLNHQCIQLRQARDQYPIMVKKYEQLEIQNQKLKSQTEQRKKQYQAQRDLKQKLQSKLKTVLQSNKQLTKQKNKILCDKEELYGEFEALKQQLEDERTDWELKMKKNTHQVKQLKITLHQEHQKLKITQHQLQQAKKNVKQKVDLDRVRLSTLQKQDLFNLLQQAEMKLVSLKMAVNDASQQIHELTQKLAQKDKSVMSLARQLTKDYPNLDESEGMEYIQKDIIEMGKLRKDDWGEIVQKVMIQNLRLKYSVTALGQQYNSMMRLQKEKQLPKNKK